MKEIDWDFIDEEVLNDLNDIRSNRVIDYYDNGQIKYEEWKLDGKRHREDGPAYQWWFENGQKGYEVWYLDGKFHREGGPAYQVWYLNGQKGYDGWYLKGHISVGVL